MGHVFISYSHKDTTYAHGLADHLRNMGFEIWIDERLDYGSQWPHEIQRQLDSCDAFILVMSPRSFTSEWVQSELQRAKRKLKPIFPLLLEGDESWLSVESTQYYDVRGGKFPDAKFFSALGRVVSTDQTASRLDVSKKAMKAESVDSSTPKAKTGIVFAVLGILVVIVACTGVVVGAGFLLPAFQRPPSLVTVTQGTPPVSQSTATFEPTVTQTSPPPPNTFFPPTPTVVFTFTPTITPTSTPSKTPTNTATNHQNVHKRSNWPLFG